MIYFENVVDVALLKNDYQTLTIMMDLNFIP